MKSEHLVVGTGQIGTAIRNILKANCIDIDPSRSSFIEGSYTILHICIPYSDTFPEAVAEYQKRFTPELTVIHSTVPVGTSDKLDVVYSPCRGVHPKLEEGIRTFVKYFGGKDAKKAAAYFEANGILTVCHESAKSVEALKLWDTTIYGWNIILEKLIHSYCKKNELDFDLIYTQSNQTYNEGYEKLGRPEFKKYILKHMDGPIGGHCVLPNLELLESDVAEMMLELIKKT